MKYTIIDFVDFLFSDISHTAIKRVPRRLQLIQLLFQLLVGLDDFVYLFERFFVLGFEIDCVTAVRLRVAVGVESISEPLIFVLKFANSEV